MYVAKISVSSRTFQGISRKQCIYFSYFFIMQTAYQPLIYNNNTPVYAINNNNIFEKLIASLSELKWTELFQLIFFGNPYVYFFVCNSSAIWFLIDNFLINNRNMTKLYKETFFMFEKIIKHDHTRLVRSPSNWNRL